MCLIFFYRNVNLPTAVQPQEEVMKQQKGFSLIEVLVSLILVATVALVLFEQQIQTQSLLNQLVLRSGASNYLDRVDESLFASENRLPGLPEHYRFTLQQMIQSPIFHIHFSKSYGTIARVYPKMGDRR